MTAVFLFASLFLGADEPIHVGLTSTLPVFDVVSADLTGDGHPDLLALCADDTGSPVVKEIALYAAGDNGHFETSASAVLPLDAASGACFLAEVDGTEGPELVVTQATGAQVFRYRDGAFAKVGETSFFSLLPSGSREPRFLRRIAHDLDDDGIDEWLIPVPLGVEIRNLDGKKAAAACDMSSESRPSSSSSAMYITHRVPGVFPFEVADRSEHALAFLTDEYADFAFGDGWKEHKRFKIPVELEEKWDTNAQMNDLSGNGLPDLVVTQTQGTINVTVLTQIYLSEKPYEYPDQPSVTFETKGAFATPVILDVNLDGKLDVLYIKVPFGLNFFANLILRKKLTCKAEVYLFKENGYDSTPDYTSSLTIDAPDGREEVAYTFGDFNGDKRMDVALGAGKEELVIHLGEEDRLLASKPWKTFALSPFGTAQAIELNGNDQSDLVIFHPVGEHKKTIDVIIF